MEHTESIRIKCEIFHVYYHLLLFRCCIGENEINGNGKRIKFICGGDCYKDLFKSLVPRQSDFSSIYFGLVSTKYILTQIDYIQHGT